LRAISADFLKSAFSFARPELNSQEDGQFREDGVNPSLEPRPRLTRPIPGARPQAGQRYALFKNAQPWKGVLPEEQSVRARMARPIRMDAGILCDRAEPPFTSHILTATPPRRTFSSPLPKQKAARRRLNSHPTGQVAIRFTGEFFCRSHITVSRRCSAINANSKIPMAILVHQELNVPSKLIQV